MAKRKADLEYESGEYERHMKNARDAEWAGLYRDAVNEAIQAWPFIDGMMQYQRRYLDAEFSSIPAIDMALKYLPLLLDHRRLTQLAGLLSQFRRIQRNSSDDILQKLAYANALLRDNYRLWVWLQNHPEALQNDVARALGGDPSRYTATIESWEQMGLVRRVSSGTSYRLSLATRMGEVVKGRCPTCRRVVEAPKAMLLEALACPGCRRSVQFVFI